VVRIHLAVFESEAPTRYRARDLPQAFAPLQSLTHGRNASRRHTLTRFIVPTAQPIHEDPPSPGFTCPGHVASSHLPCASTPYSLHGLPGVLSTRCARGTWPSELDRTKIALASRPELPLLRLANHSRVKQTIRPAHVSTSPRLVAKRPLLERVRRLVPLGSPVLKRATSAAGIAARRGLASGACSLRRLETSVPGFLLSTTPWLSWPSSSLRRSPSRAPSLSGRAKIPCGKSARPHGPETNVSASFTSRARLLPLMHSRKDPGLGPTPCATKFQRAGKLA